MRRIISKYSFLLILIVILREISLPYFMNFWDGTNKIHLLSELGESSFPLHHAFDRWEFIDGILFILGAGFVYQWARQYQSNSYAKVLAGLVALYGLGDCLLTSMLVYSGSTFANWHSFLHSLASVAGYCGLYGANLLIAKLKKAEPLLVKVIWVSQLLSLALNLLMESPLITNAMTSVFLQCLALDLMYLPLLLITLRQLKLVLIKQTIN